MDKTYFCAGLFVEDKDGNKEFCLMRQSKSDHPYISMDKDSHALRLCGNTSALYLIDLDDKVLRNMNDIHYKAGYPKTVKISDDMLSEINRTISLGDFLTI